MFIAKKQKVEGTTIELLKFLCRGVVPDQILENCQDVLPITANTLESRPELRLNSRFFVPFRKDRSRNSDVAAQFVRRMAA